MASPEKQREYSRRYRIKHLEQRRAYSRKYNRAHYAERMRVLRAWRLANPEKMKAQYRRSNLKRKTGISVEKYNELLKLQGGKCAIDGCIVFDSPRSHLHVDHDHTTGIIRGLLCSNCNTGLGLFEESPQKLMAAVGYLDKGIKANI